MGKMLKSWSKNQANFFVLHWLYVGMRSLAEYSFMLLELPNFIYTITETHSN